MALTLPPDFKDFLKLLASESVDYLLVGGYAVGYYGYPRATGDMDIWIAVNPDNAARVTQALRQFGFRSEDVKPEIFLEPERVFRMGNPPLRIELLTGISGVEFSDCYARKTNVEIDGVAVSLIDLESLKQNKRASGRLKDLSDVENLP